MKRLCAINDQLDNWTVWHVGWMKRLLLFVLHFGTIHSPFTPSFFALLVEKISEVTPTISKALTCWISQILNTHFTCIEYLWSVESENHIGLKKRIVALNRLFHGSLHLTTVFHLCYCSCPPYSSMLGSTLVCFSKHFPPLNAIMKPTDCLRRFMVAFRLLLLVSLSAFVCFFSSFFIVLWYSTPPHFCAYVEHLCIIVTCSTFLTSEFVR